MTAPPNSNDSDADTVDLADFISDRSELFVVMGVVGAVAVYISRSPVGDAADVEFMIDT